ncbi:MAG: methyl-accepting chemotaxis protein [Chloroflexota bacterium]
MIESFAKMLRQIRIPLFFRLMVAILLTTLIPLALVGFLNTRNTQTELEQAIGTGFQDEAESFSNNIARFLGEQVSIVESIALDATIKEAAIAQNNSFEGGEQAILDEILARDQTWINGSGSEGIITRTLSTDPSINPVTSQLVGHKAAFQDHIEIFVTDMRGATVGSTDRLSDYYQADEGWWQAAYANGQGAVFISDPEFDDSAGVTAVLIALPIYSQGTSGQIVGVVRSTLVIDAILAEVGAIQKGATGRGMLLASNGTVIADPRGDGAALPEATLQQLLGNVGSYVIAPDAAAEATIFGHAELRLPESTTTNAELAAALEDLNWIIIVREATNEALAAAAATAQLSLTTIIIAAIAAVAISFLLARLLTAQVNRIQIVFSEIARENFNARVEVISGDELGQLAEGLNGILDRTVDLIQTSEERDQIEESIIKLLDEVSGVADGDLTREAEITEEITGAIADSFNFMITELRNIITNVQDATLQVSSSANEIQVTAEHLAEGSESQASQIIDTSAAIDEMSVSIQQVSENATLSAAVGEQAAENAQRGARAVRDTIAGMGRIQEQVQETGKRIRRLGESSEEIGIFVELIEDIADRTAVLALNASIQASMAGEAGVGFAVVAEEVESLAEQVTDATKQIANLTRTIQSETTEAVQAMDFTTKEVTQGSQLAQVAGQSLVEIETVSQRLSELIQSISLAAQQQARGSETIARSMNDIAEVTQQTAAGTKQAAVSINNLAELANGLRGSVSTFKLPNGQHG